MKLIDKYFPSLPQDAREMFARLDPLYREWNAKINVISRKDIDALEEHHILHSLAIARAVDFPDRARVLDIGTGGGFPGIPLAILFPKVEFVLCDSIGKKIRVAQAVATGVGLSNVTCINARVETVPGSFDFAVSRAVAPLDELYGWVKGRFSRSLVCLKGGGVEEEAAACVHRHHLAYGQFTFCPVNMWFEEDYFLGKQVVILSAK